MNRISIIESAKKDRMNGLSILEIAKKYEIAKSTASLWVRSCVLPDSVISELYLKKKMSRIAASKAIVDKRIIRQENSVKVTKTSLGGKKYTSSDYLLICGLLYECEGGKSQFGTLEFTNSDPLLVSLFLKALRNSCKIDESKLRVAMHLHDYHNETVQKKFWSEVTGIPESLFFKTFNKSSTHKQKKENYQGCVQIKYFDVSIKRQLLAVKDVVLQNMGL
jgi:hypothetical protein